jgi:hypothetical protein
MDESRDVGRHRRLADGVRRPNRRFSARETVICRVQNRVSESLSSPRSPSQRFCPTGQSTVPQAGKRGRRQAVPRTLSESTPRKGRSRTTSRRVRLASAIDYRRCIGKRCSKGGAVVAAMVAGPRRNETRALLPGGENEGQARSVRTHFDAPQDDPGHAPERSVRSAHATHGVCLRERNRPTHDHGQDRLELGAPARGHHRSAFSRSPKGSRVAVVGGWRSAPDDPRLARSQQHCSDLHLSRQYDPRATRRDAPV